MGTGTRTDGKTEDELREGRLAGHLQVKVPHIGYMAHDFMPQKVWDPCV